MSPGSAFFRGAGKWPPKMSGKSPWLGNHRGYKSRFCNAKVIYEYMGVSENVGNTPKPNGFADHYPVLKWLFHWEYTLFSDKPIW